MKRHNEMKLNVQKLNLFKNCNRFLIMKISANSIKLKMLLIIYNNNNIFNNLYVIESSRHT